GATEGDQGGYKADPYRPGMGGTNGRRGFRRGRGRLRQVSSDGQLPGRRTYVRDHLLRRQGWRDPQQKMAGRRASALPSKCRPDILQV
ncbi:MAG: hypothetical protein AVDCRST_MAG14-1313, partial [uncultured Rubrobacteraceae bacterium]